MSERSSAWLEHLLWEQDVAGSNPVAPTIFLSPSAARKFLSSLNSHGRRPGLHFRWWQRAMVAYLLREDEVKNADFFEEHGSYVGSESG